MIKLKNILLETNIFKEAKYNANTDVDDIFFLWDAAVDDDRQGIEHGNGSSGSKRYSQFIFNDDAKGFDDFEKKVEALMKKNKWEYDFDGDVLTIYESVNDTFKDINVNYIQVDTNFQNMTLQKQGVLDEFFLEEVIGDIEAHIDDSNLTDDSGNPAFDITRLVSDLKFDCEIKIDNSEIDLTITFDANGDILDVDIDDESIAEKYGITTETIMAHLESKGI